MAILLTALLQLSTLGAGPAMTTVLPPPPIGNCLALEAGGCVLLEDGSGTIDVEGA